MCCHRIRFALASKIICQFVPFHSTMSFALATKSMLLSPFQASAPSTFCVLPISFNNGTRFPFCFIALGLEDWRIYYKVYTTSSILGPTITVSVGIVSISHVTNICIGLDSFNAIVPTRAHLYLLCSIVFCLNLLCNLESHQDIHSMQMEPITPLSIIDTVCPST